MQKRGIFPLSCMTFKAAGRQDEFQDFSLSYASKELLRSIIGQKAKFYLFKLTFEPF